ncbi:bifunctional aspartate carbamoyltransferase catalytic subunit/aspartate carbamoyltransferase regulatory subunit [Sediminispirochaeta bajacaliforniensis]|uniref:bifunctional aspartate carbamoyltransferase catalytic subunit/aspartate carbamoyltransferase regulatory subunit n=1 Tax=Sediminispirochaeta bajacaliforniensis TaxID=148 RepID=UPI0003829E71|nr:bifunctional aspartate carbamoyltransferase catalytic subunit/aspartate carbamoyltransferase regulatory subunit [Sediminispirochaeta bajacaliforniensis]
MNTNTFQGRTLAVIRDFSQEERLYLFSHTRRLKQALLEGDRKTVDEYRIDDGDFGIYEVFLEDSTRTKESFKNAAQFHGVKLNSLDVGHSSINKKESYADTFNTLCGYDNKIFIVRSTLEGVCRWLEENGKEFARRNGLSVPPAFINAGDGKHEHPTQELLDEFSFLEQLDWDESRLHIALVGDLYHGRTVHSKVDGLRLFGSVSVDLIAPKELAMPEYYVRKMEENDFAIRTFPSIEEYLSQANTAPIWYFTRPQLERMGDDILKRQDELRSKIVFRRDFLSKIADGTKFYHPLPRHKEHPTIPTFLDDTELNGWENQSINGKLIRIVLLSLIAGKIGDDFVPKSKRAFASVDDEPFLQEVPVAQDGPPKQYAEGVNPISDGIVIDHICRGDSEQEIREHMARIIGVLKLYGKGGEWVTSSRIAPGTMKGIIFRPGFSGFDGKQMKQLAAIAPGSTLNIIHESRVVKKLRLHMPPRIYNFDTISCSNTACISHPSNGESVPAEFFRVAGDIFVCKYCEKPHTFKEIWK